ncbi:ArsR/SmtB family transcription factor [Thermocatellispora tengchongensis]|uniref:ArsR/SmtB family transcription factor n=1 Tax=Thermocatellispora tengchongensis TaxID=1073253 RepID=UPI003635BAE8
MFEVAVIEDPAAAGVSLDPVRARLLAELADPASATTLAAKLGLPRQKVNHHLKTRSGTAWWGWSRSAGRATSPSG